MATLIVTNLNDAGAGSLRQAVLDANASVGVADTIVFSGAVAGGTLTLTSGGLSLSDDVTIDGDTNGDHKADITISGNNTSQILAVGGSQTDAVLKSLTLTNGKAFVGGAIYLSGGPFSFPSLTISDTTISNCSANIGGAIYSKSNVTISNSLITNNTSNGPTGGGGGIYMKGGGLTLSNSTLDGNNALLGNGGGIALTNYSNLNLVNSTVTNNNAQAGTAATDGGGGISVNFNSTVNITNSVITQNTSSDKLTVNDVSGVVQVADHSVFSSAVAISNNSFSLTNVADVGLGTLGNHGGTTATREILTGSILINAGSNAGATGILTDANGNPRISGGTVDIGASEYSILTVTNLNASGAGSLADAIATANLNADANEIVFQAGLNGTITLASGLVLSNAVTINGDTNGDGDADVTLTGGQNSDNFSALLNVASGTIAVVQSLGFSGRSSFSGAGAIENSGTLTLSYSVISNNVITGSLSLFYGQSSAPVINNGILTVNQTMFSGNSATGYGGYTNSDYNSPGNNGGNASASILNLAGGVLTLSAVAVNGGGAFAGLGGNASASIDYTSNNAPVNGQNGGNGGHAAIGILNLGTVSGSIHTSGGSIGTHSGGSGALGLNGGSNGTNGVVGSATIGSANIFGGSGNLNTVPTGTEAADTVSGIGGLFYGLGGADVLSGNALSTLFGGAGNDTLTANRYAAVRGGLGNDIVRNTFLGSGGYTGGGIWDGGAGIDTFDASLVTGNYSGSGLSLNLSNNINNFNGTVSNFENIIGTNNVVWVDVLTGNSGDNVIQGLGGFDILDGGAGNDTLDYSEKIGNVTLALNGAITVFQKLNGVNEDTVSNFENIIGGSGADVLTGDGTDNTFRGGLGGDTLNGAANTAAGDTLSYEGSAAFVVVNLALNTASGGDATGDLISNFENVTGSSQRDQLTGNTGANALKGGAGDDVLAGGAGADSLDGGAQSDTADYRASTGTNIAVNLLLDTASGGHASGDTLDGIENLFGSLTLRDILIGDTGNNILKGFGGIDSLQGGNGDDFIEGGADGDAINGGVGVNDWASYRDSNIGQVSINLLTATHSGGDAQGDSLFFIENLEGSLTRRDILIGNIVANRILGNGGVDSIQGGDGNDFIDGGTGGDSLNAGAGIDTLSYEKSSANVTIDLNVALQVSDGDANGDNLFFFENVTGSDFGDNIKGNYQSNRLAGGLGADILNGGTGSDYLTGGADADTFRFTDTAFGSDTILDWQDGSDKISLALSIADAFSDFTITGNGTAHAVIKIIGVPGSAITVNAAAPFTLDAGDFVFV